MLCRVIAFVFLMGSMSATLVAQDTESTADGETAARRGQTAERNRLWAEAQQLASEGKRAKAIQVGEAVLAIERRLHGDAHKELAVTLEWLAHRSLDKSDAAKASNFAAELWRVQEALLGKDHWQTVNARLLLDYANKLGLATPAVLRDMVAIEAESESLSAGKKYTESAAKLRELLLLEQQVLGNDHPFCGETWYYIANKLAAAEQYRHAETAAKRAFENRMRHLGDRHPDTAQSAWLVALSRIRQGNHAQALDPLVLARDIWRSTGHLEDQAWMDSWRGDSLVALDQTREASIAYRSAVDVFRQLGNSDGEARHLKKLADLDGSIDLVSERNGIWERAKTLRSEGKWVQAAAAGERVLAIEKVRLGVAHSSVTAALEWLAGVYESADEWTSAGSRRQEILRRRIQQYGEEHWEVVDAHLELKNVRWLRSLTKEQREQLHTVETLNREMFHLYQVGKFASAVELADRVRGIRKMVLGEEHPDYATNLNDTAYLYTSIGDYTKAMSLYTQALEIRKKVLGESHPNYAISLNGLALLYQSMGDYTKKAMSLFTQALEICQEALGEQHPDYATSLNNLAGIYESMGDYAKAETHLTQALAIYREVLGEGHLDYATGMSNLASLYQSTGDYTKAMTLSTEALEIRKKVLGEEHVDYARGLSGLAGLYQTIGDYTKAEPLFLQALEIIEKALGDEHPSYADGLSNLGLLYYSMGKNSKAEPLCTRALEIDKSVLGEEHPDYATGLNNLAAIYESMGDYEKAEPLHAQALEIGKSVLGEEHPDYATGLNGLAVLYHSMGDYVKAEPLHTQALEIRKKVLGEEHPDYATGLSNLAQLYVSMGEYAKAEPLHAQALEIKMKVLGEEHPDRAISLNNLAVLYSSMGDYAKAESLHEQALEIRKKVLGEEHPDYANGLNNLALLYQSIGEYTEAEPLLLQALAIKEKALGDEHPSYANTLSNLGLLYYSMGEYAKAEPLYTRALEIDKSGLGEEHPQCAALLINLASLYASMGEFAKAEPLYRQALEIEMKVLGEGHPSYAVSLRQLARLYESMGDYTRAEPLAMQALAISRDVLENAALVSSERQQLAMNQMLRYGLDSYLSMSLESGQFYKAAARQVLTWKGATLVRQRDMRQAADDPKIADRFRELQQVATQLASLSRVVPEKNLEPWRQRIRELTAQKEALEAQLSRESAVFREASKQITLEQIQSAMPEESVLVDYLQFTRWRPSRQKGRWNSETSLLAIVVRPGGDPRLVELGPVAPLNEAIDTWRETFGMSPRGLGAGWQIRQRVWEPLLEHIGAATTVLVSTDGVLGRMPLGALPGAKNGSYLIEEHRLAMIPVPQLLPALVTDLGQKKLSRELLLMGDVDYDANPAQDAPQLNNEGRPGRRASRAGEQFGRLPGTVVEIANIGQIFRNLIELDEATEFDEEDIATLDGSLATEARFRKLAPQFNHLHLATHGFFASADTQSALSPDALLVANDRSNGSRFGLSNRDLAVTGDNPGLLSGLAFAGANREPDPDADDGILTAQEIAFLPLGGVESVVLSACETGLGEVAGGEGLLGIQRAIQIAGARTTVATFWKVDDLVTQRLMEMFYRNLWEKNMSRLDALREAQLAILRDPDSVPSGVRGAVAIGDADQDRTPANYWGAFTLSGDWR